MLRKYFNSCTAAALLTVAFAMPMTAFAADSSQSDSARAREEFRSLLPQVKNGEKAPEKLTVLLDRIPGEDVQLAVQALVPYLTSREDIHREQAVRGLMYAAAFCKDYAPSVMEKLRPLRADPYDNVRLTLANDILYVASARADIHQSVIDFLAPLTRDRDSRIAKVAAGGVQLLANLTDPQKQGMAADAARYAKSCPALSVR